MTRSVASSSAWSEILEHDASAAQRKLGAQMPDRRRSPHAFLGMQDRQHWRVPEVAERLRVDPETVRRWLRAGKLRGMLLSQQGGYRISDSELQRFIAERLGNTHTEQSKVAA
jgi:excisionase family DNA binding protein